MRHIIVPYKRRLDARDHPPAARRRVIVQISAEEIADSGGNLDRMGFEREVAGVEEFDGGVRNIPAEGFRSRRQEERIVLAPDRQDTWLVGAELGLKGGIECHIALVVAEEIELHIHRARPRHIETVE